MIFTMISIQSSAVRGNTETGANQSATNFSTYYDLTVAKACREGLKKSWSNPLSLINDYRLTVHNIKLS